MLPSTSEVYLDVVARARETLTALTGVYKTQRLNRENWTNLVNDDTLVPEYLIVEMGERRPMPFAMDVEAYVYPFSLYWVRRAGENTVMETGDVLNALASNLLQPSLRTCSLMNAMPTVDVTETNPANTVFFGLQAQLFAGMISFEAIVGCGVYVDA